MYITVYIPVVNVGMYDVLLCPRSILGSLTEVYVTSMPPGIAEVRVTHASVQEQEAPDPMKSKIEGLDFSALSDKEQGQVCSLLFKYRSVFAAHESDLGYTRLLSHEIPLLDNVPVRQHYCRLPPSEYEVINSGFEGCTHLQGPVWRTSRHQALNSKTRKDAFPLPRIDTHPTVAGSTNYPKKL